jgi:hypothetical protein
MTMAAAVFSKSITDKPHFGWIKNLQVRDGLKTGSQFGKLNLHLASNY